MKDKIQKTVYLTNILLFLCSMGCLICYDVFGDLWLKGATSVWFVLMGLLNLLYAKYRAPKNFRFLLWIEAGLVLGMCADVLLECWMILGILSFALGHICYLIGFYTLEKPKWKDLIILLPATLISVYVAAGMPYVQIDDPVIQKFAIVYAIIIGCMLGKSIVNIRIRKSTFLWLLLLGSVMFWFSDVMLAINMFGPGGRVTWVLCSYVYWPAQNLLAHSMFHYANERG